MPASALAGDPDREYASAATVAGGAEAVEDAVEVATTSLSPAEPEALNGSTSGTDADASESGEASRTGGGDGPSVSSEPEGIDGADAPYKKGDIVVGRTMWCNDRGAKIELLDYEGHNGFIPRQDYPYRLLEQSSESILQKPLTMNIGHVREYEITNVPSRIIPGKLGPLLSARRLDKKLMMDRMVQIFDVCRQDREVWRARVFSVNRGGLKVLMVGRACFIPKSHIIDDDIKYLSPEEFLDKYKDKDVEAAIIHVDPIEDRVVMSMKRAEEYSKLKSLRPGSLVWGNVRKVLPWGAFVAIDGTHDSALIHRSNVSKGRFSRVEDIFEVGDRVCAVIIGMEDDCSRISCSTADLEEQPGDMVRDRQYVYNHAEEQMEHIRAVLAEREDGIYDELDDLQELEI